MILVLFSGLYQTQLAEIDYYCAHIFFSSQVMINDFMMA